MTEDQVDAFFEEVCEEVWQGSHDRRRQGSNRPSIVGRRLNSGPRSPSPGIIASRAYPSDLLLRGCR
jgi:hypothetical protein